MPAFNTLLVEAGLDPRRVQLVRHQAFGKKSRLTPYLMWRNDRAAFDDYQRLQVRPIFKTGHSLASFVVSPNGECLFTGLYSVIGEARNQTDVRCRLSLDAHPAGSAYLYQLALREELSDLIGLMTIDWGAGTRAWVQRADNKTKPVTEIRRQAEEPKFPGFNALVTHSGEVLTLPATWAAILAATGGVYLMVSLSTGEQYVGSATGEEGFWSRWAAYATDGHGGNVLLKQRGKPPYRISILETAPSTATRTDVLRAEQRWKERLGSRAFGLNAN